MEHLERAELHAVVVAADPHHDRPPAAPGGAPGRPDRLALADALDGDVRAAARPSAARTCRARPSTPATNSVAPQLRARSALSSLTSTAMIGAAPRQPGALHRGQPDPAEPEDQHGLARPDPPGVEHGAHPGEDRAPEQRRDVQWYVVADGYHRPRGHHGLFGEGAGAEPGHHVDAVEGGVRDGGRGQRVLAQPGLAVGAVPAAAAGRRPVEDDPVTGRDVADLRSDREHRARAFVAEDHREVPG